MLLVTGRKRDVQGRSMREDSSRNGERIDMAENKLDNTKLEEAVSEFVKDRQKEKYASLMELLERAVVLVPTLAPQGLDQEAQRQVQQGGQVKLPKDAKIMPCLLRKEDGGQVFPIFTSMPQIPKDKKSPAVLAMPFFSCVAMVMGNQEKVESIVLNPFTHNVVLPKGILEVAQKRMQAMQQTKTVKMTEKQFEELVHNRVAMHLLPKYLFAHKEEGFQSLQKEEGELMMQFYREMYPEGKKDAVTVSPDDFSMMTLNLTDNLQMIRVDLPVEKAKKKGMCYRVYAVWLRDTEEVRYYTFERTEEGNQIGQIMPDGRHELVEQAPDNGAEIEAVMHLAGAAV